MSAFDKLCRMLDERGARYFRKEREGKGTLAKVSWVYPTGPDSSDVFIATIVRYGDHLRFRGYLTPEQAIAATLGHSSNCTNSERTNAACKPTTYDNGYSADRVDPGDYYEFWEPACACGNCGELIPMRKFCPNCGCRLEVEA